MKARIALVLGAAVLLPTSSFAALSCPDRVPAAITAVGAAGQDCQEALTKEGGKFVKKMMKQSSKCFLKEGGACPSAKVLEKIVKAGGQAEAKITAACSTDAAQAALSSSYASLTDDTVISSCMLSQHNAIGRVLVGNSTGITSEDFGHPDQDSAARASCIKELGKRGTGLVDKALKNATKCINKKMEDGFVGDLVAECVGQWSGGTFTAPLDSSTATKQAKHFGKIEEKIGQKCAGDPAYIASIFACEGKAETVEDLQNCIVCGGWDGVLDILEQQYSETGTFVANGPGAIQAAEDVASPGDKLLIASGEYEEQVTVDVDGLALVGCGGATDERPNIERPGGPGPFGNGVFGTGLNGATFQSLKLSNWDDNGIFVSLSVDLVFRDIIGEGNLNSEYAVFPVTSDGILIEACDVYEVTDAGIYVGQSTNYTIRYSRVEDNVAGLEVENSAFANVHNVYATNNTGGLLAFKLPGPPVQLGSDHRMHHNVSENNNTANFGSGSVGVVPDGTGFLVISDQNSTYDYNISRGNASLGLAVIDQAIANFLALPGPPVFDPTSPDQATANELIERNKLSNNGFNPDNTPPNSSGGVGGDIVLAILEGAGGGHGNCIRDNIEDIAPVLIGPSIECPVPSPSGAFLDSSAGVLD
jgi:parallel beta-helix repeat protein